MDLGWHFGLEFMMEVLFVAGLRVSRVWGVTGALRAAERVRGAGSRLARGLLGAGPALAINDRHQRITGERRRRENPMGDILSARLPGVRLRRARLRLPRTGGRRTGPSPQAAWPVHGTVRSGHVRRTRPRSTRGTPPSSSGTTSTRSWRAAGRGPVHECAPGFWAVTRYEDIRDLSRDPEHFCSGRGALVNDPLRTTGTPMAGRSILHMDPPEHAAFRRLVNRRFTPRALSGLAESIRKSAARLLDAVEPREEIDFVAELAAPFPLTVIAELLGIDEADREDFRALVRRGDRVARPAAGRDHGGARRALGVHRRAHPVQARPPGGGPRLPARRAARSAGAR